MKSGTFRTDLYYRISVMRMKMPRLQERREDIPLLAEYFLKCFNARYERNMPPLSKELMSALQTNEWPGNIREFKNHISRYVIVGELKTANMPTSHQLLGGAMQFKTDGSIPLKRITKVVIREVERKLILKALEENRWNRRKTAQALNISYRALLYKIREARLVEKRSSPSKADATGG